jgi:GTP-binding protein EngB required for normal cell division
VALNEKELAEEIEGIIDRLEEARSKTSMIRDLSEIDLPSSSLDSEIAEEIEGMEAALLIAENKMDEVEQVIGEEIDNLRGILESIEENL